MLHKLVKITALCSCFCFYAGTAKAIPLAYLVSQASFALGVSFSAAMSIATGAISLAGSLLVAAAAQRLSRRRPSVQQQRFDLLQPNSRPIKRFVYGRYRAPASPVRRWVKGRKMYQLCILNSRPSEGNFTIFLDGRECEVQTGDMFSFSGPGARLRVLQNFRDMGSNNPRVWIGRGDQMGPPAALLAALPEDLVTTDAFRGLTVLWAEMDAGGNGRRFDRWPNGTRTEIEVDGHWSLVWDPRDATQNPDDPETWKWSDNQALCTLDAILQNPIRRWPRFLVNLDAFIDAANLADEAVPLKAGGTVPRYRANGILAWNGAEIMDQVQPLADAGAGDLVKIGGQVTYSSGAARPTVYTITDILDGEGLSYQRLRPSSDLAIAVKATYVNPDRDWQEAELPALALGAGSLQTTDDGIADLPLGFVTEPTQAMRVQKIVRNRMAAQKTLSCLLPPDAIRMVAGSVAEWGIPELPALAGRWRVQEINPHIWLSDNETGGVAMRCAVTFSQEPDNLDAWNPAVDEFDLATEDYIPPAPTRIPPDDLQLTTGPGVAAGNVPRIRLSFEPVEGNVVGYEWQWRVVGAEFEEGGTISDDVRDGSNRGFAHLAPVTVGEEYEIRVRTVYLGAVSDFATATIVAAGLELDLDPPVSGAAIGGAGEITVEFQAPNNAAFQGIEFWTGETDDLQAAALLEGPVFGSANAVFEVTHGGLGEDVTRYFWARSVGAAGIVSTFAGPVSATTDP